MYEYNGQTPVSPKSGVSPGVPLDHTLGALLQRRVVDHVTLRCPVLHHAISHADGAGFTSWGPGVRSSKTLQKTAGNLHDSASCSEKGSRTNRRTGRDMRSLRETGTGAGPGVGSAPAFVEVLWPPYSPMYKSHPSTRCTPTFALIFWCGITLKNSDLIPMHETQP